MAFQGSLLSKEEVKTSLLSFNMELGNKTTTYPGSFAFAETTRSAWQMSSFPQSFKYVACVKIRVHVT